MHKIKNFDSLAVKEVTDLKTTKSHILPIYPTSSFEFESLDQGISIFTGQESGHVYSRYGNPTVESVAAKIAQMESFGTNLESSCILFSSGMSAIATLLMATLRQGEKILTQGNLYGGTTELMTRVLKPLGIETIMTDLGNLEMVDDLIQEDPSIKMIFFETPANPTLACVDIAELCHIADHYGCLTAIDNTFATPYLQQPLKFGVDFIIHSTTKFLNGHGNSIAGAVVGKDLDLMRQKIWTTMKLAGTNCNPWDAWLLHNGMKTLTLRMDKHSQNALELAQHLESHPSVAKVNYCGLASHPDHEIAKRQMSQYGGMLSFELKGGLEAGKKMMNKIRFCTLAPTLGDVDTLILHPASMSHLNVPKEVRLSNGITDGLIRVSVGIENLADILDDLTQAME